MSNNKKPFVNDSCIGCGTCTHLCPKSFEMDEMGKAHGLDNFKNSESEIETAIQACPVNAISWKKD